MGTISRFETVTGALRPTLDGISRFEIVRGDRPNQPVSDAAAADLADGMATLRACRGAVEGVPLKVAGSVISTMMAEFLARWPENSRGEILRILNAQASAALELLDPPPPDTAA